jgi:TonB family protein
MAYSYNSMSRDRDRDDSRVELFKTLEFKESRKRSLWMSVVVHGVLLSVLLAIPLIFTETMKVKFNTTEIVPPMPKQQVLEVTHYKAPPPKPVVLPKPVVAPPPPKPIVTPPPELKPPEPPKVADVKLPEVIERAKPAPVIRNTPHVDAPEAPIAAPKPPEIKTGVFSTGSSATPTANLPAQKIQTGGFGDPNGIKGEGKPGKTANIASLGSFDLPVGPGAGNGTGGARGVKGVIASSGFGNGVAPVGNGGGGGAGTTKGTVRPGGFGDVDGSAKQEAPKKRAETGPAQTPVEILFKPKPDYTDDARKARIEGEVLVRVLFTAAGEVKVLDVTRGLGHGLDETALRAAQQIKFKPAQRDGQPVDSTATVHIVFQMAY